MKSKYILVSAHHCAPNMGSEHAVGWQLVSRLAEKYNVILVTENNQFRKEVEFEVSKLRDRGCDIKAYFVKHGSVSDGRKNNIRIWYYITYRQYQRRVLKLAKKLMQRYNIVAVHHLNIVGFREPGYLWKLGIPFIWGPVGGLVYAPKQLYRGLTWRLRVFMTLRNLITNLQFNLSPRVKLAYRATQVEGGAFIAATPDIGQRFTARFGGSMEWIPETGSHEQPCAVASRTHSGPLKLLWLGALIDIKPLGILLDALANIEHVQSKFILEVVGDGDARQRHETQAKARELPVRFSGWLPHAEAIEKFANADIFVLLSVKDLTTNVVFEALSRGVPVICLDHHGYSFVVDESCGVKISVSSVDCVRDQLIETLNYLSCNREIICSMSQGALSRALEFTWSRNAEKLSRIYEKILPPSER